MKRMIFKVGVVLVGAHLLFGAVLLTVDAVGGINDQNFSFALALAFYYLNYPAAWLISHMGFESNAWLLVVMGSIQWVVVSIIIGGAVSLFGKKKGVKAEGRGKDEHPII